jgi:hypothetical protein
MSIAGPTYDPLPVFDWQTAPFDATVRHRAQPTRFQFTPITYVWTNSNRFDESREDY